MWLLNFAVWFLEKVLKGMNIGSLILCGMNGFSGQRVFVWNLVAKCSVCLPESWTKRRKINFVVFILCCFVVK